jgi:Tol biopolymer transport system component
VLDAHPGLFELHRESGLVTPLSHGNRAHPEGCYGPDGRFVASSVDIESESPSSTIVLSQPGQGPRRISEPGAYASFPACAPDGSSVVWVDQGQRRPRLFAQSPPGEGEIRELGPGRDPVFSPDGAWIVFSAPVGLRGWRLWRIRPDGSGRSALGRGSLDELRPGVSPDGRHVVYVSESDFRTRLYVRRFDGTGDRILLGRGAAERPIW